jgi:hypothetical protein
MIASLVLYVGGSSGELFASPYCLAQLTDRYLFVDEDGCGC